ncbi:hypothetical protein VCSRO150_3223 [Vibrio cholerae]|nr:putative transposase [Vibrio cholerae]GHW30908.1 hypothetical protein VCSRO150_3223 [Vibrio cholerae]
MSELIKPFMHFQIIKDYRQESKVEHKLSDIILLTICGVLSGHDGWDSIIDIGNARLVFLNDMVTLKLEFLLRIRCFV